MLVMFGFFDLFSSYAVYRTADQGVYRAVRRASLPGSQAADLEDEIRKEVERLGLEIEKMVIEHNDFADEDLVAVTLDVPLEQTSWLAPLIIRNRTVRLEYTRQRENFPRPGQLQTDIVVPPPGRRGFNLR
jgi:hypothetical protein